MGNRITNKLVISGHPARILKVLKTIKGDSCPFDFERIVPIPGVIGHAALGYMVIDDQEFKEWYMIDDERHRRFTPEEERSVGASGASELVRLVAQQLGN